MGEHAVECNEGSGASAPPVAHHSKSSAAERSRRASQSSSIVGEMTAGIAHDFRNILAVIESSLRLVERSIDEPDRARTFIAGARDGVARGLRLTSQLLAFASEKELPSSAVDVNELLANMERFLQYGAGPSVSVEFELSPNVSTCLIGPVQFATAILNLVINARDAMPHGGKISITTDLSQLERDPDNGTPAGAYVRVRVSDNGMGMREETLQNVFQPFFTTKGKDGTGLGVPQVCAFMRRVGGHLSVKSEIGGGTTFDLFFPALEGNARLPQAVAAWAINLRTLRDPH